MTAGDFLSLPVGHTTGLWAGSTAISATARNLYEMVGGNGAKSGVAAGTGGKIPQGGRHNALVSLAGTMRHRDMSVGAIDAALWSENLARCEPPYDRHHVRQIAESAGHWEPSTDWRASLIRGRDGTPRAILANAITALRQAPEWAGVLAFNEFSVSTVALRPAPFGEAADWSDHEDLLVCNWLQHAGIMVGVEVASQAVQSVGRDRSFHPVRDYLGSLKWDGVNRLDGWLPVYLGAETNAYTAAVGARWIISAVARIYTPGAKADCCLILEGPQGLLKSTALRTLAAPYFTDEMGEVGTKDASLQTLGVWVVELAELDSLSRGEVSKIKAFMSRTTDRFRPPYGRRLIESPRQCVFAGSVNHSTYLRDETGGRRFWPVACTRILIEDLKRDKDQLWAEAVVRYHRGDKWWLDSAELNLAGDRERANRYDGDPWDSIIAEWIERPAPRCDLTGHPIMPFSTDGDSTTIADVLTHAVGKRVDQWTQTDKARVARVLKSLGWERYRRRDDSRLEWRYRAKHVPSVPSCVPSIVPSLSTVLS